MVATLRYGGYIIPLPVLPDRGRGAATRPHRCDVNSQRVEKLEKYQKG